MAQQQSSRVFTVRVQSHSCWELSTLLLMMQSCAMAYDEVTEDNVYLCVGHPPRRDIENIVKWMLNDHFSVAYNSILLWLRL